MRSPSEDWHVAHRFRSRVASLSELRRFLGETLAPLGLPVESRDRLILAAHETATNLIRHVFRDDRSRFLVTIRGSVAQLRIEFVYRGPDFDPAAVAPPNFDGSRDGGFGLYLIGLCADSVTYDRVGSGACRITLIRRLDDDHTREI